MLIKFIFLYQESEVCEARKVKASHENMELLKEKLLEEKGRRERTEAELLKLFEVQLINEKLEAELAAWRSLIKDIPGVSRADDVPLKFAALQKYACDLPFNFSLPKVKVFV